MNIYILNLYIVHPIPLNYKFLYVSSDLVSYIYGNICFIKIFTNF